MEIKAWINWYYLSSAYGYILDSFLTEFQGSFNKLQEELKKRNEESKKDVTVVIHETTILSVL